MRWVDGDLLYTERCGGRGATVLASVAMVWLLNLFHFMGGIDGTASGEGCLLQHKMIWLLFTQFAIIIYYPKGCG